jgi:hypothetical protein
VRSGSSGASGAEAAEAERELRAGGRALLEEISSMRGELRRLSVSLRQHAAAITEALEELDASAGPDPVGRHDATDPHAAADTQAAPDPLDLVDPEVPANPLEPDVPADPHDPSDRHDATDPPDPRDPPEPLDPDHPPDRPDPHDRAAATRADARLVALDMALGGSSREDIDRELAARFDLAARAALIDEVLAAIA